MMNAAPPSTPEDGSLPAALTALDDALHALIGPQTHLLDGKVIAAQSRYLQLLSASGGEQSNTGGGGGSRSRAPGWLDAFQLRDEIDQAVAILQPAYNGVPPTVGRLRWFRQSRFRPQDCHRIEQITSAITSWASEIDTLLNPEPTVYLMSPDDTGAAACPSCNTKWVYRLDSAREKVRQPALKVTKDGAHCQRCRTTWEPYKLRLLAGALGYPLPAGVLE